MKIRILKSCICGGVGVKADKVVDASDEDAKTLIAMKKAEPYLTKAAQKKADAEETEAEAARQGDQAPAGGKRLAQGEATLPLDDETQTDDGDGAGDGEKSEGGGDAAKDKSAGGKADGKGNAKSGK